MKIRHFFFKCNSETRASASKFRRIMSAVGATLLQSPGWNEGKARNGTLGTHGPNEEWAPLGAVLTTRVLGHLLWGCAAPMGLNKCGERLTQGLRPGLWKCIALKGSSTSSPPINYVVVLMRLPWDCFETYSIFAIIHWRWVCFLHQIYRRSDI